MIARRRLWQHHEVILERAIIHTDPSRSAEFEQAWREAIPIPASASGFVNAELLKGLETPGDYLLLIHWETLEDHTVGFRESDLFTQWRAKLGPFFADAPDVEHYDPIATHPVRDA